MESNELVCKKRLAEKCISIMKNYPEGVSMANFKVVIKRLQIKEKLLIPFHEILRDLRSNFVINENFDWIQLSLVPRYERVELGTKTKCSAAYSSQCVVNASNLTISNGEEDLTFTALKEYVPDQFRNYDFKPVCNPILKRVTKDIPVPVQISELYTPENFYLHFTENLDDLNEMADKMNKFYEINESDYYVFNKSIREGILFACKYSEDSKWYRVQVLSKKEDEISVKYIDFGNTEVVLSKSLRYLCKRFAKIPAMSLSAKLHNIKPKHNTYEDNTNKELFKILLNHVVEANIPNIDILNHSAEVKLYYKDQSNNKTNITNELVALGLVQYKRNYYTISDLLDL